MPASGRLRKAREARVVAPLALWSASGEGARLWVRLTSCRSGGYGTLSGCGGGATSSQHMDRDGNITQTCLGSELQERAGFGSHNIRMPTSENLTTSERGVAHKNSELYLQTTRNMTSPPSQALLLRSNRLGSTQPIYLSRPGSEALINGARFGVVKNSEPWTRLLGHRRRSQVQAEIR